jgi:acyl-CoA dehydrogenase
MYGIDPFGTPEKKALRELTVDFTQREIVPNLDAWEATGSLPRELHKAAAAVGLLGLGFDESLGGSGGDFTDVIVMTEAMLEAGASGGVISALFTHGISLPHIIDEHNRRMTSGDNAGADYLADTFIRPVLAGDMILALGVSEPDGGSDVARLRTTATAQGDDWRVSGAKTYITSGVRADRVVTAVRTAQTGDGAAGITLMILDPRAPGYAQPRALAKMGWWCSDTAELAFTEVPVAARDVLGLGKGFESLARHFVSERLSIAATAYATAQRSLDLTIAWTRNRETFGRPLSTRQVVRHTLVDMYRRTDVARSYTRSLAQRHASGDSLVVEAALAKQTAVEAAEFVVDRAVQLHGGMGYMRESEVERHYRDARILGIGGGATEVMTDLVARLLGY